MNFIINSVLRWGERQNRKKKMKWINKQKNKKKKKEKKKKKRTFFRSVASHANDTQGRRIKPRYLLTVNSLGALIIYIRVYIKIDWWQPTIQLVDIYDISDRSRSEDKKEKKKNESINENEMKTRFQSFFLSINSIDWI